MSEDGGPCPDRRRGTAMSTVAGRRCCSLWLRTVTADPSQCGQLTDLGSYAPQIQEHFRKHDFPDAQKGVLTTLSLNLPPPPAGEQSAPQLPVAQTTRYTFQNMGRTAGFILDPGALTFQTTEYDVFDTLSREFQRGVEIVHAAVGLSFTDRIGFRYLDAVFPKANETLADYLSPTVLGLGQHFRETMIHSLSETRLRSADNQVIARVIIQDGEVGLPPDLAPGSLTIAERFRGLRGRHAILDTDGFFETREPFSLDHIRDHLRVIHDEIAKAFQATVTPRAIKAWE
jgi:uncharacterized protein (TIGR04255 family)